MSDFPYAMLFSISSGYAERILRDDTGIHWFGSGGIRESAAKTGAVALVLVILFVGIGNILRQTHNVLAKLLIFLLLTAAAAVTAYLFVNGFPQAAVMIPAIWIGGVIW